MHLYLALIAAFLCAICNGTAAVLEKIGADTKNISNSLNPNLIWQLKSNKPYIFGIVLDLLAWLFTIYAVHNLPLFIVQPIVALSILVTVIIEYLIFKRSLGKHFILSISLVMAGLIMLALVATPETNVQISHFTHNVILLLPILIVFIGAILTKSSTSISTYLIALISGIAFGSVSIAGRAVVITGSFTHLFYLPITWTIIFNGVLGILFFTIALQRASASSINASMISAETLFPIIIGLLLLNDHPRHNLWIVMYLGVLLSFCGTMLIAISSTKKLANLR